MKNKISIIAFIFVIMLSFGLVACKKKTKSIVTTKKIETTTITTKSNTASSSSITSGISSITSIVPEVTTTTTAPAVKLNTPHITIQNGILSIASNNNSNKYKIFVNDQVFVEELNDTAYSLSELRTPGTYKIYVIALGNNETTLDSEKSNTIDYIVHEPDIETIQLSAPVIRLNGSSVTWASVSHSTKYEVYIDGVLVNGNVTTLSYSLDSIEEDGDYMIKVKAVGDGLTYTDSNFSNEVKYTKSSIVLPDELDAPVITLNGNTISWEEIDGAIGYQVFVNGVEAGIPITDLDFEIPDNLIPGIYKYSVIALGDDTNFIDSDFSNEISYEVERITYDSLEKTGTLTKTTYYKGTDTQLDLSGLTFKAVYSDGGKTPIDLVDLVISSVDFTITGEKTVTISYTEDEVTHSTEIIIIVIEKEVSSIEVDLTSTAKLNYTEGDSSLNLAGITIIVNYSTGTRDTNVVVTSHMIDDNSYDLSTPGTYNVIVSFAGKTDTFEIVVAPTLSRIEKSGSLVNNEFKINQELTLEDLNGITITKVYSDNTEAPLSLTLDMITYDFSELGDSVITITYQEKTVTIDVTVIDYAVGIQVVSKNNDKYTYDRNSSNGDFLAENTISKIMAVGDPIQLTAEELGNVTFTRLTPGHREIEFTFGELKTKHTYDITYTILYGTEFEMLDTYLDGYYELGQDINCSIENQIGLTPLINQGGEYFIDKISNGTIDGQVGVPFVGKFNGKGYKISDLKILCNGSLEDAYGVSLFSWIGEGAVVENFVLDNMTVSGYQRISFIASRVDGTVKDILIRSNSTIKQNSVDGVSWTPQFGVFGVINESATIKNVECLVPNGKNGTNDVEVKLSIDSNILGTTEKCYVGPNYPVRILSIRNKVEVQENSDVVLNAVFLEVEYRDGESSILNPTRVSEHDKGLLGVQHMTFYIDTEQVEDGYVSIEGTITVVESQKVLVAELKDTDTVALVPFDIDGWKLNLVDWSIYIDLTANNEPINILDVTINSDLSDTTPYYATLVINGEGLTETRINIPVEFEIDCKEALFKLNSYPRGIFKVTCDIDCENEEKLNFTGGNNSLVFYGTLDGQNHSITNIYLVGNRCGMIRELGSSGVVKNIRLYGDILGSGEAGIVTPDNRGTIENVYFEGTFSAAKGGLVYYVYSGGVIRDCVLYGTIDSPQVVCNTNNGTIDKVLVVYDVFTGPFSTILNESGVSTNVQAISSTEVENNETGVNNNLWELVLNKNKVLYNDIALDASSNVLNIVDNNESTFALFSGSNLSQDSTIRIDLGELKNASTVYVLMDENAYLSQYEFYYAESLSSWTLVGEFTTNYVIATINKEIRYIKIVRTATGDANGTDIKINEIGINKVAAQASISYENIVKYEDEDKNGDAEGFTSLSNMLDDDSTSFCWFKEPTPSSTDRPYIMLDLGSVKEVTSIAIEMANEDYMADYLHNSALYYSVNGTDYIKVGDYISNMVYHNFYPFVNARYIKIEYTGDEPNGGDLIIREFKVNLDLMLIGAKPNYSARGEYPLTSILYATDSDSTTSFDMIIENNTEAEKTVLLDLHEVKEINTINLITSAPWGNKLDRGFKYSFSNDGINFTELSDLIPVESSGVYQVNLEQAVNTRFVRIFFDTDQSIGLTEISAS